MDVELTGIDHIGAPTWNADAASAFYTSYGVDIVLEETVDAFNIRAVFLDMDGIFLEFLEPTGPGPTKTFLEQHGPGFQHVAYRVEDIDAAVSEMREAGVRFQSQEPLDGVGGSRVIFIEESTTAGFQTELVERADG